MYEVDEDTQPWSPYDEVEQDSSPTAKAEEALAR